MTIQDFVVPDGKKYVVIEPGKPLSIHETRAKADAPVATPLSWDELKGLKSGAPYTVKTLPARLKRLKGDPWDGFFSARQSITAKARKALGLG